MPTSESKLPHQSASELGVIDSPWKNKKFTHSEVVMTTMRAIEFLPNLLLAMFIGVWVDRSNKKRWTQTTNLLQGGILLLLFFLLDGGYRGLWLIYLASFILMTLNYSYANSSISMVKQVLPRELLTAANANFSAVSTLP